MGEFENGFMGADGTVSSSAACFSVKSSVAAEAISDASPASGLLRHIELQKALILIGLPTSRQFSTRGIEMPCTE